jgi:hypothetical protein
VEDEQPTGTGDAESGSNPSLKKIAAVLGGIAAVLVALGAIATAATKLIDVLTDDDGGGGTSAQSAAVKIHDPRIRGSNALFDADVTVKGLRGRQVRVLWTLIDAEAGDPVNEKGFERQPIADFKPSADSIDRSFPVTVPAPQSTDLVFLRVEVFDEAENRLGFDDSGMLRLGGTSP